MLLNKKEVVAHCLKDSESFPQWLMDAFIQGRAFLCLGTAHIVCLVKTRKGFVRCNQGDYITMDERGRLAVLSAHKFQKLYEPVKSHV